MAVYISRIEPVELKNAVGEALLYDAKDETYTGKNPMEAADAMLQKHKGEILRALAESMLKVSD